MPSGDCYAQHTCPSTSRAEQQGPTHSSPSASQIRRHKAGIFAGRRMFGPALCVASRNQCGTNFNGYVKTTDLASLAPKSIVLIAEAKSRSNCSS